MKKLLTNQNPSCLEELQHVKRQMTKLQSDYNKQNVIVR